MKRANTLYVQNIRNYFQELKRLKKNFFHNGSGFKFQAINCLSSSFFHFGRGTVVLQNVAATYYKPFTNGNFIHTP